jgi:putative DNA primase/helicase
MTGVVTVERLAKAKRIPASALRMFGLENYAEGVRFRYCASNGQPARARLRTAMRGADGSAWEPDTDLPISAYTAPPKVRPVLEADRLIIVEGESDCWTAWFHGIAACGIPGADRCDALDAGHVSGITTIDILREPAAESSPTYRDGVTAYRQRVLARLQAIGFTGAVYELRMPDDVYDLSELHQRAPERFLERLAAARAGATSLLTNITR